MRTIKSSGNFCTDGPRDSRPARWVWAGGFALWLGVLVTGAGALAIYGAKATPHARAATTWPAGSELRRDPERSTLLMFLHPGCPCSRASLGELEMLMARSGGRLNAQVIFLQVAGLADDRTTKALRGAATRIPGVTMVNDRGGREAGRFHAGVSGDTFVFDQSGALRFRGGITGARGHVGENAGRLALQEYARTGRLAVAETPVFGCALFNGEMAAGR